MLKRKITFKKGEKKMLTPLPQLSPNYMNTEKIQKCSHNYPESGLWV